MDGKPASGSARLAWLIATCFGLGDRLPAPGTTVGSLLAAASWWLACLALPAHDHRIWATAAALVVVTPAAVWSSGVEARRRGRGDPRPVVVDELAGQWLCFLVGLPLVGSVTGLPLIALTVAGFFLFRFFDVVKPWPVRPLERIPGGWGIVADDLAAGILAGLLLGLGWRIVA